MKKNSKERLVEVMSRLDKTFKVNENYVGSAIEEEKVSHINPDYSHFAVTKTDNKILNGWDYRDVEFEDLKMDKRHYFWEDLKDMDIEPKNVLIYTRRTLSKKGIDPQDTNNWYKYGMDENDEFEGGGDTAYAQWDSGKLSGLGSFHTALMQCYRLASQPNRAKLADAFPEYFK